ncbi:Glycosyltransferase involved in cell wall bisynthesis [Micromonospora echinaurantiaca]|uniref:Glycosyltransferase involved in cell wall bisynthesis n=1 Tax=Micromonospora echinaurantiaca TaxID=47857 RepID=A0A1C5IXM3_9ACTN|nr:glycosyltransferase [Micromonospora echinaurantiaca]SCG62973.1 Glycosyltransferase involved in cell wall bisynthesis [Micromonospora echinaurantiaca]
MKISILSAVYNEQQHVEEMIASVRSQLHPDWELLFVDDGSTDRTVELITAAAAADPRIQVVGQGRKIGKARAFNLAYAASTGAVVVLLAGDDIMPVDSLRHRAEALGGTPAEERVVAFFKLRTFSENPRWDGMVLPRGDSASRSGGSITMTRGLADLVFPIDESLRSEDIWLGHAAEALASRVISLPHVVLHYRMHEGNSNQRAESFTQLNESTRRRHQAYQALLASARLNLPEASRQLLKQLWWAEELRYNGQTLRVLFGPDLPLIDRLAIASMSDPTLYRIRSRYFKLLSGRRNR